MAHFRDVMAAGVHARLAMMLGHNRLALQLAAGTTRDTATLLEVNYGTLATSGAGTGFRLRPAVGQAMHVFFNTGPATATIYADALDNFNGGVNSLQVPAGATIILVPSEQSWLALSNAAAGGGPGGGMVNPGSGPQIAQYPAGTTATVAGVPLSGDAALAQGGALTVTGLQGRAVANIQPADTQVLAWSQANTRWQPAPAGAGGAAVWDAAGAVWDGAGAVWDGSGGAAAPAYLALTPIPAPAAPASGSVIYADSGNANRVTIKNAAGATIVIGP